MGQPTETFYDSDRAPSFGLMVGDRGNSETASFIFSDDAPPSYTDVARRAASQTDESSVDHNLPQVNFDEASSTAPNFGQIYPYHAAELEYSLSPNASFKGSFTNWQKGDFIGSGPWGPIYEGFNEGISCANILVDASGSVKLVDFGLAKVVNTRNGYGLASDIWSLGCTVLEMLTRKIPYSHLEAIQVLFRIGRGVPPPIPETLSAEARDFILKCLQANPKDRPTAAQLLEHPFLTRSASTTSVLASPVGNVIQL